MRSYEEESWYAETVQSNNALEKLFKQKGMGLKISPINKMSEEELIRQFIIKYPQIFKLTSPCVLSSDMYTIKKNWFMKKFPEFPLFEGTCGVCGKCIQLNMARLLYDPEVVKLPESVKRKVAQYYIVRSRQDPASSFVEKELLAKLEERWGESAPKASNVDTDHEAGHTLRKNKIDPAPNVPAAGPALAIENPSDKNVSRRKINDALTELFGNSRFKIGSAITDADRENGMIDMHMHTATGSDGAVTAIDQVKAAIGAGVQVLQITDHNTFAGYLSAKPFVDAYNSNKPVEDRIVLVPAAEITLKNVHDNTEKGTKYDMVISNVSPDEMGIIEPLSEKHRRKAEIRRELLTGVLKKIFKHGSLKLQKFDIDFEAADNAFEAVTGLRFKDIGVNKKDIYLRKTASLEEIEKAFEIKEGSNPGKFRIAENVMKIMLSDKSYELIRRKVIGVAGRKSTVFIDLLNHYYDDAKYMKKALNKDGFQQPILTNKELIETVHQYGGKVILAHPMLYYPLGPELMGALRAKMNDGELEKLVEQRIFDGKDQNLNMLIALIAECKSYGLDGISVNYLYSGVGKENDLNRIAKIISDHFNFSYTPAAESDDHGPILGSKEFVLVGTVAGVPEKKALIEFKKKWFNTIEEERAITAGPELSKHTDKALITGWSYAMGRRLGWDKRATELRMPWVPVWGIADSFAHTGLLIAAGIAKLLDIKNQKLQDMAGLDRFRGTGAAIIFKATQLAAFVTYLYFGHSILTATAAAYLANSITHYLYNLIFKRHSLTVGTEEGEAASLKRAVAYANNDVAFIAWQYPEKIPNCLGFAVYRTDAKTGNRVILPAWVGFKGQKNDKWEPKDTSIWPVQRFNWRDLEAERGASYVYEVVPMIGKPGDLKPDTANTLKTGQVTVSPGAGKIKAFFNRGYFQRNRWLIDYRKCPMDNRVTRPFLAT